MNKSSLSRSGLALAAIISALNALPASGAGFTCASADMDTNTMRIVSAYTLSVGRADHISTYISPLNYHGPMLGVSGAWSKGMPFSPLKWRMRFDGGLHGGRLINTPGTALLYSAGADFSWGMARCWTPAPGWHLSVGGAAGIDADADVLLHNSNNPVSADIWSGLSLTAHTSFSTHFGRLPVTLTERIALPLAGAFFMPGYGESYYEIYIGNHSGLIHFGYPGNAFALTSDFSLSMHFRRATLSVGYRFDYTHRTANNLLTRRALNALTITLTK